MLCEQLKLRISRVRALQDADPNLAMVYLRYTESSEVLLGLRDSRKPINFNDMFGFLERDQKFYNSILENLVARPEPVQLVQSKVSQKTLEPSQKSYDPVFALKSAIENNHPDRFSNYHTWVDCLVEDVAGAGYTQEQVQQFAEALKEANLSKYFRHRENLPDSDGLNTFSQDVKLNYLIHGKVPTGVDLKGLYEKDVGNGNNGK